MELMIAALVIAALLVIALVLVALRRKRRAGGVIGAAGPSETGDGA